MDLDIIFKNKKVNFSHLENYGFIKKEDKYTYSKNILNNKFKCLININEHENVTIKVIDNLTEEEYILAKIATYQGEYVNKVREEVKNILKDIASVCYEEEIYKSEITKKVIKYLKEKYDDDIEFLWENTNAIFRNKQNKKWYAALLIIPKTKIGLNEEGIVEILNLKNKPEVINELIDNKKYFPGYHMNKKHWFTICLDYSLPLNEIYKLIDISYNLTK